MACSSDRHRFAMPNQLAQETSPYLLQHAEQPVDWHPWGEAALALARAGNKPILLSIGYSACHWCHVMAHESFDDPATAQEMNELFVNIKVDREERPDLDQIYQQAHQMLTRQGGGWPLTIFLSPEGVPFHSGTYYPPEARYGRPAFRDLLGSVATAWRDQREAIARQDAAILQAFVNSQPQPPEAAGTTASQALAALAGPVQEAARLWADQHLDATHGGFGQAPKFPHPTDLAWLLDHGVRHGDAQARQMALLSLSRMAAGGLLDQLGGGFFRYSVDERWEIPHFEKMLCDNGQLLALYADAAALTGDPVLMRAMADTAVWAEREMQLPEGGFASSLDADSEGEEGRYYVWTTEALRQALKPLEWDLASGHWNVLEGPNFEGQYVHLHQVRTVEQMAQSLGQPQQAIEDILRATRAKLLATRDERPRPGRDDKVLVSWNAMMVTGLARAAAVASRPDWLVSARKALDAIRSTMWVSMDGRPRLLATARDGRAHLDAYLDDHACLIEALLTVMQADFRLADLQWAQALADELLAHFEDPEQGGFFFTRHDHEALIHRPRSPYDNATPSGNGVAAWALQRLGRLLGDMRYLRAAERTLALFAADVARQPATAARLLSAAVEHARPPTLVVLRGAQASAWAQSLLREYRPHTLVVALPEGPMAGLPSALDKPPPQGDSTQATQAWVCDGPVCLPPVDSLEALRKQLTPTQAARTLH
jgi:uncharacterized protein YyaL (SSP411 family)